MTEPMEKCLCCDSEHIHLTPPGLWYCKRCGSKGVVVYEDDVREDGSIEPESSENGPQIQRIYLRTEDIMHSPNNEFVSFSGAFMGHIMETRIPYEVIFKIAEDLKKMEADK